MAFESTQSKYKRVPKADVLPEIAEHEVRITTSGQVKKYVDYALGLFGIGPVRPSSAAGEDADAEPKIFDEIVLKATGRAINHAVTTAEVVKRRVPGLHQITRLATLEIKDDWEPTEEGLEVVTTTRRVASVEISLKKEVTDAEKADAGYQAPLVLPPLYDETFTAVQLNGRRGGRDSSPGRRGGRGRRGPRGGSPAGGSAPRSDGGRSGGRSPGRRRGGRGTRGGPRGEPRDTGYEPRRDRRSGGGRRRRGGRGGYRGDRY